MHEGHEVATVALGRLTPRIARVRIADHLVSIDDGVDLPTSYRNPTLYKLRAGRMRIESPRDGEATVTVLATDEPGHVLRAGLRMSPLPAGRYGALGLFDVIGALIGPNARRIKKERTTAARRLCAVAADFGIASQ